MENDKEKFPLTEEEQFTDFDFEFVHQGREEKIHDEKLQTKPTTFAKDALKRFAKNKASVVGAVIIGILLLGSFLSYASPHDISQPAGDLAKLMPKIREAKDGFWDGTLNFVDKIYDEEAKTPYGVNPDNVVPGTLKIDDEVTYYDSEPNAYATGGYYRFTADRASAEDTYFFYNYTVFTKKAKVFYHLNAADQVSFKITLGGTDGVAGNRLAPLSVYITGRDSADYEMSEKITPILLADNLKPSEDADQVFSVDNISAKLAEAGLSTVYFAQFRFEFPSYADAMGYTLVKSLEFSCGDGASEETKQRLAELSFDDANWVAYFTTTEKYPEQYWQSNAHRLIYRAHARKCSYLLDQYKSVFGLRTDVVIGGSILRTYIDKGWCTMSDFDDISTFKVTNPDSLECPLRSITGSFVEDGVYQFYGEVIYYRYLGMNSIPYYIFGTDAKGHDMLTLALSCLKNSLLLAIITSAICLAIGLVWGSVSGYFGGNVDLIMERITDILSGVPWIVVMTLVMLLLGRTYVTFGIAVCLTGWIGTSSRTRTQFYRFKGREYVLASRTLGASDARLIFRHILPNGLGTIVTGSVLMIPSTIFSEATLSYLGLGLQGTASFGVLLAENQSYLNSRPMLVIFPSIIVSLLMISFNLFGNGLRDALNPTLKGGEQ